MDRSTKIIQLFEQVFEPYHMMFREMKGEKKSARYNNVSEKKNTKKLKRFFWGGGHQLFADFCFS